MQPIRVRQRVAYPYRGRKAMDKRDRNRFLLALGLGLVLAMLITASYERSLTTARVENDPPPKTSANDASELVLWCGRQVGVDAKDRVKNISKEQWERIGACVDGHMKTR
jgi:hypothetical protein